MTSPLPDALFTTDGATITPTELCRGPWDPNACHGGPIGALIARAVERAGADGAGDGPDWQLGRITLELLRPVPMEPLVLEAEVVRPGRKVSLVDVVLRRAGDSTEVSRARALRIRDERVPLPEDQAGVERPPFASPEEGRAAIPLTETEEVAFHTEGAEIRYLGAEPKALGPTQAWIRLRAPVFAGEEPTGFQRALAAADFGNGVSAALPYEQYVFINPDLTVHFMRPPTGEWIGLDVASHYGSHGAGLAESALYDVGGRIGRGVQSLFLERRPSS
jgi:acyl-coenzyme A thioesterase PaaI-like protein